MVLRKKGLKKQAKKFDKLITTIIIWGAIASIFWASRTKKGKKLTSRIWTWIKSIFKKWFDFTWRTVVSIVNFFSKK